MGAAHGIEGSFVVVHEFMAKGLGLKGNDLIVYARIFGSPTPESPTSRAKPARPASAASASERRSPSFRG